MLCMALNRSDEGFRFRLVVASRLFNRCPQRPSLCITQSSCRSVMSVEPTATWTWHRLRCHKTPTGDCTRHTGDCTAPPAPSPLATASFGTEHRVQVFETASMAAKSQLKSQCLRSLRYSTSESQNLHKKGGQCRTSRCQPIQQIPNLSRKRRKHPTSSRLPAQSRDRSMMLNVTTSAFLATRVNHIGH